MSTVVYEFTANHASELWSTDPAKMVDGTETSYASTTTDGDIQCLITNECVGTDLGTISKVEIRPYAYSDDNDQLILRPVFGGSDDGDNHTIVPGVSAGWKAWQIITLDTNCPLTTQEEQAPGVSSNAVYGDNWLAQTFTPSSGHDIAWVGLYVAKISSPGTLTVSIKATDGSGHPTGADLTSSTVAEADIPSTAGWILVPLTAYTLTGSTKYAIVIRALSGDASNMVSWYYASSDPYAGGNFEYSDNGGSSWAANATRDFGFKEGTGSWAWSDVQNLDCDVEQNDVSKGNTMYCGMVQAQVTYTAEAPPAAVGFGIVV